MPSREFLASSFASGNVGTMMLRERTKQPLGADPNPQLTRLVTQQFQGNEERIATEPTAVDPAATLSLRVPPNMFQVDWRLSGSLPPSAACVRRSACAFCSCMMLSAISRVVPESTSP